jgi:hypothetical protein
MRDSISQAVHGELVDDHGQVEPERVWSALEIDRTSEVSGRYALQLPSRVDQTGIQLADYYLPGATLRQAWEAPVGSQKKRYVRNHLTYRLHFDSAAAVPILLRKPADEAARRGPRVGPHPSWRSGPTQPVEGPGHRRFRSTLSLSCLALVIEYRQSMTIDLPPTLT